MKSILHKADTRGHASHGWLESWHTFSFASYHDPARIHFGALRVLNDDSVSGGMGFGMHPHDNMEIITIPLEGQLEHKDSMGNSGTISKGEVQVMSAGTGIQHAEKNKNLNEIVKFLQIWVFPNKKNVTPRYDQKTFNLSAATNKLITIVSPMGDPEGLNIYQDAWFNLGKINQDHEIQYELRKKENGVYLFVLEGEISVNGQKLNRRDAIGITDSSSISVKASKDSELLLMELPMN